MKIKLNNFRSFKEFSIEGSGFLITGKNGLGKSNLLKAFERVLFSTINGAKRTANPIMTGTSDCKVSIEIGDKVYERNGVGGPSFINTNFRNIMFCNLLDQEPRHIKSIMSEILVASDAKKLFGKHWQDTLENTIIHIRGLYAKYSADYNKIRTSIDTLTGMIDKLNYDEESKSKLNELSVQYKRLESQLILNKDSLMNKLIMEEDMLVKQRDSVKFSINGLDKQLLKVRRDLEQLSGKVKSIIDGTCPTCGAKTVELGGALAQQYKQELRELNKQDIALVDTIEKENKEKLSLEARIKETQQHIGKLQKDSSQKESERIKADYESIKDRFFAMKAKVDNYFELTKQRQDYVDKLIAIGDSDVSTEYDYTKPKGEINRLLQEKLDTAFASKGYEVKLFEEQSRAGEDKAVMNVYKDGVEYRDMCRSDKLRCNVIFSTILLDNCSMKLPLLIDDFEMFSPTKQEEVLKYLYNNVDEYIACKVTDTDEITVRTLNPGSNELSHK